MPSLGLLRDPRPWTVPLALTESFNELGEDPGVAFHEAPLPGIARHGPGHTPPRSTSDSGRPWYPLPPSTDLSKPAAELVNPTSPRLLPDSLRASPPPQRDRAREDALATQEPAKLFPGRARPVADSEGAGLEETGRGFRALDEETSGTLSSLERGRGQAKGAGLIPGTRTWRPGPLR